MDSGDAGAHWLIATITAYHGFEVAGDSDGGEVPTLWRLAQLGIPIGSLVSHLPAPGRHRICSRPLIRASSRYRCDSTCFAFTAVPTLPVLSSHVWIVRTAVANTQTCVPRCVPTLRDSIEPHAKMLADELIELMNRTLSSNLVSESMKQDRITLCINTILPI